MRTIKLQIASGTAHRAGSMYDTGPEQLRTRALLVLARYGDSHGLGAMSIECGMALFADKAEAQVTITLHEANSHLVVVAWEILRAEIDGVDCGRIYDRGKSWCAKAYVNAHAVEELWPGFNFEPVECTV